MITALGLATLPEVEPRARRVNDRSSQYRAINSGISAIRANTQTRTLALNTMRYSPTHVKIMAFTYDIIIINDGTPIQGNIVGFVNRMMNEKEKASH